MEKYSGLHAVVMDVPELIPVARERAPRDNSRLEFLAATCSNRRRLLDINMSVFIPGRERSIQPIDDNFGTSIVEGVKLTAA